MEKFNVDELFLLALELDLSSIINFCKTSKRVNEKICKNELFWKLKVDRDFLGFTNRQNSYKEQYVFLTKILTKERFEEILKKPDIASDLLGVEQDNALDLYDLLYKTEGDHNWGVIRYHLDYNEIVPDIYFEFNALHFLITEIREFESIKEGKIGRIGDLLREIKENKHHDIIEENWDDIIEENQELKYPTFEEYIESLKTFERRFQDYIVKNTPEDVRKQIKQYQSNIGDNIDEALYDDEQIEFLQILHDGIRSGKLNIFDPVDYDFLMNKLK